MNIKLVRPNAKVPVYATLGAAGADLFAACDAPVPLWCGEAPTLVPTGIAIDLRLSALVVGRLPFRFEGQVRPRSGLSKKGVHVALGTIDEDYRGEIFVCMWSTHAVYTINPGDRIAQLVISPVALATFDVTDDLDETARGAGGFGSTGR